MTNFNRQAFLLLAGFLIFGFLLYKFNFSQTLSSVSKHMSLKFYGMLSVLICCQMAVRAFRFQLLLQLVFGQAIRFGNSFILTAAGFFVGLATPNRSGEMLRGCLSASHRMKTTWISIIEYLLETAIVVLVPLVGFLCKNRELSRILLWTYVTLVCVAACGVSGVWAAGRFSKMKRIWERYFSARSGSLHSAASQMFKRTRGFFIGIGFTLLYYAIFFLVFHLILTRFGVAVSLLQTVAAGGIGVCMGALSLIPMGLGSRDTTTLAVLGLFGASGEAVIASVVVLRSLSIVILFVGCTSYFINIFFPWRTNEKEC